MRDAMLVTADGELFRGRSVGSPGVTVGEAVFNTAMTGYTEIITDPSYKGQVVVMTSSHIGNYGVTIEDTQSTVPAVSGLVTRAMTGHPSSWRADGGLTEYLREHDVVALTDVDTRRLTRHIRDRGAMPVAMGSGADERELKTLAAAAPRMTGQDLASVVTTPEPYRVESPDPRSGGLVVAIDLGVKRDILGNLTMRGYDVVVLPAWATAEKVLGHSPSGVFLSNGPGDPEPLTGVVETVQGLLGKVPLFGICLGHQVLGLAVGGRTFKLPFGHHGGNHPVRRLDDGRVEITSQNHGFAVDLWSLTGDRPPPRSGLVDVSLLPERVDSVYGEIVTTHQNLNDGTLEGMRLVEIPAFSVQYHPEAAPGPRDALGLFDRFARLMEGGDDAGAD
ncbi:MAG: glutamine-hydrolyzing carbamoyl-phosphate synthase small subunit [Actinobacteria bacterium]|nr:glutamine-hydrolyzing carbamoyl-phosphate synthase small subunit [Actinomycetota bacterium]